MAALDDFVWHLQNTEGVTLAAALPTVAREVRGLFNEQSPKWKVLSRNSDVLASLVGRVPSSAGLQNLDCSRMPVFVFTADHRATTLARVVQLTKDFEPRAQEAGLHLALASGNAGVMAATNEEIKAREWIVIVWVHLTLLIFVWLSFRSVASVICIITPLVLCSLLTYGFMSLFGVGMKAATLPVAAFGGGIADPDRQCRDVAVLRPAVPGRHGPAPGLHVHGQSLRRAHDAAGPRLAVLEVPADETERRHCHPIETQVLRRTHEIPDRCLHWAADAERRRAGEGQP